MIVLEADDGIRVGFVWADYGDLVATFEISAGDVD